MAKKPAHHLPRNRKEMIEKHQAMAEGRLDWVPTSGKRSYLNVVNGHAPIRLAVKVMCLECMGWERKEVERCTSLCCPLYRFRPFADDDTVLPKIGTKVSGRAKNPILPKTVKSDL